eukprot:gene30028-36266_t
MDFTRCFEILSARQHADKDCPCCTPPDEAFPLLKDGINGDEHSTELSNLPDVHLLERFVDLQRKRMEVYRYFDEQLLVILESQCLPQYPNLCNKTTELFSSISSQIISIKDESTRRGLAALSKAIGLIQAAEKEKLTLVAAQHLDKMRAKMGELAAAFGEVQDMQADYLRRKVAENHSRICEQMEEVQAIKIDILEST